MNVLVYADAHLYKTEDGKVWAKTIYEYDFWKKYLYIFDCIIVMARMKNVERKAVRNYLESSGPGVTFIDLPMVMGSENKFKYIIKLPQMIRIIHSSIGVMDCGIFRVPSIIGYIILYYFAKLKKPYALEVVGNIINSSDNKLEKKIGENCLKRAVEKANGVAYVTQYSLQKNFPSHARINGESEQYFESYYSSIDLKEKYFAVPRDYSQKKGSFKIIHVSNHMNNDEKGHKIVIDVTKRLYELGYDIQTYFIGDGGKRKEFEKYSSLLGLEQIIHFVGIVSSADEVRKWLLNSDLFLFPSRAEGLPRVVIEAMAVGLPCLATPVGGIPELLPGDCLAEPTDTEGFVRKIVELLNDAKRLNEISKNNIKTAKNYEQKTLQKRRDDFYNKLKNLVLNQVKNEL